MTYVLAAYLGHDANVCVVGNGKIVHFEAERFSRKKHDTMTIGQCIQLTNHALDYLGITIRDITAVAAIGCAGDLGGEHCVPYWGENLARADQDYTEMFGPKLDCWYIPHHLAHAAYAFYTSPFESSRVIGIDGGGDAYSDGTALPVVIDTAGGWMSQPFGSKDLQLQFKYIPNTNIGGRWEIEGNKLFNQSYAAGTVMALHGVSRDHFVERTGFPLDVHDRICALERDTCETLNRIVLPTTTPTPVSLAGGVALNGIAIYNLMNRPDVSAMHVPPSVHDGGMSVGAALFALHAVLKEPRCQYSMETVAFSGWDDPALRGELPAAQIAEHIAQGKVVAVANGRAESGPRALGHRSFLADPRSTAFRDRLNVIKGRQPFRPTAPVVLREHFPNYFVGGHPDCYKYMTVIGQATDRAKSEISGGLHEDFSARVQTVEASSPLGQVLIEFQSLTGTPVLLNTSFNLKGESICNTKQHAIDTFSRSSADVLVTGSNIETR